MALLNEVVMEVIKEGCAESYPFCHFRAACIISVMKHSSGINLLTLIGTEDPIKNRDT